MVKITEVVRITYTLRQLIEQVCLSFVWYISICFIFKVNKLFILFSGLYYFRIRKVVMFLQEE